MRLVALNDGVGEGDDALGGAVVLLEADGDGVRVVLLERQDVLDIGAAEGVDGLRVVAHDADVVVLRGQQFGEQVLGAVRVLVLVDVDVLPALLVGLEQLRVRLEEPDRPA